MLIKRFEQLYPFIKTETLRLSSFSLLSKIQTEARAGAFKADVIEIAGVLGYFPACLSGSCSTHCLARCQR